MFCSNCGTKIDDNAKFCLNCGAKVMPVASVPSVSDTETVYPVQTPDQPAPAQPAQPDQNFMPQGTIFPMGYDSAEEATKTVAESAPSQVPQQTPVSVPQAMAQETAVPNPTPVPGANPPFVQSPPSMGQTPQYTAPPVAKAPKKKKGKGWIIAVAALLVLALIGGGLYYVKSYRPQQQSKEYQQKALDAYHAGDLDTAMEYLEKAYEISPDENVSKALGAVYYEISYNATQEGDTSKAVEYAEKWYALLPNDDDLKVQLITAYWDIAFDAGGEGDYRTAIDYCKKIEALGVPKEEMKTSLFNYLNGAYNLLIMDLTMAGDTDQALMVLEEGKPYLTDDEYNSRLAEINGDSSGSDDSGSGSSSQPADDGEKPVVEEVTDINTLAQRIAGLSDNQHTPSSALILPLYTEYVDPLISGGQPYTVKLDSSFHYDYVRFYPSDETEGGYYVYYGQLDASGNRSGEGWIISCFNTDTGLDLYFYNADWVNDIANGFFVEYNFFGEDFSEQTMYTGTVKDYLYDGSIKIVWKNGETYYATYNNGVPEVLGDDPDDGQKIIAYNEYGDLWLKVPASSVNDPVGLEKM